MPIEFVDSKPGGVVLNCQAGCPRDARVKVKLPGGDEWVQLCVTHAREFAEEIMAEFGCCDWGEDWDYEL